MITKAGVLGGDQRATDHKLTPTRQGSVVIFVFVSFEPFDELSVVAIIVVRLNILSPLRKEHEVQNNSAV